MDKHFIVLNGKRYDAVTGALLGTHSEPQPSPSKDRESHTPAKSVHAPRAVVSHPHNTKQSHTPRASHHTNIRPSEKPQHEASGHTRSHHKSDHIKAHKPQGSKTLMRRVVNKPSEKTKALVKQQYPVARAASGVRVEAPKRLAKHVDSERLVRAKSVAQSDHVGRFQAKVSAPIQATVAHVAVAEAPAHHSKPAARIQATQASLNAGKPLSKPIQHAHAEPKQHKETGAKKTIKVDIFEQALADAKSHEATPKSRRTRRWLSAGAAIASVLVIGGFVAFLSRSAIELQLASVQAGFAATMPTYVPEGFSKESLSASNGRVTISFAAPDNQNYTISQQQSNWDSQTLFDSLVAEQGNSYQVVQNNGRNIYIYGDSEAAWVDGGILFKVSGNAKLTSDQIISIASGI